MLRARTSLIAARGAAGRHHARRAGPAASPRCPNYAVAVPGALPRYAAAAAAPRRSALARRSRARLAGASNAWAAGPTRSATGGTLLANDPHLGFTAPSIWYLARLELPTGGVIGGTIPGRARSC